MPEYPDITIYVERLNALLADKVLQRIRFANPFLLRSVDPPISAVHGLTIKRFVRMGKRIVFEFDDDLFLVLHLMIAGRLRWKKAGIKIPAKRGLASFDFEHGSLLLTEAASKKRASLYLVRGAEALEAHNPGGLEVLDSTLNDFREIVISRNHTLRRFLTDPRLLSGIGNAYSDEILHYAKLSPVLQTGKMTDEQIEALYKAILYVLPKWTELFRKEVGDGFPDKVTTFRPEMAVHGKHGKDCPVCSETVQRIRFASNETNYCPTCQTEGKLLADRSLSRLLKSDWPKTPEELEQKVRGK